MGKGSKRKVQGVVTDSPKKAKLELTNKADQESPKLKNKKQQNEGKNSKTKANVKSEKKIKISPQKDGEQKKTKSLQKKNKKSKTGDQVNQPEKVNYIIPAEFAKNLNKRQKQHVARKIRDLTKLRQTRGEDVNNEDIRNLIKEYIAQKPSNKTDKSKLANDPVAISTNGIPVAKTQKRSLPKKEKMKKV